MLIFYPAFFLSFIGVQDSRISEIQNLNQASFRFE